MSGRGLRLLGLAVAVFVGLLPVWLVVSRSVERGRFAAGHSSFGAGPGGTRALFELTQRLGYEPLRWVQDFSSLPAGGLLVAFGECGSELARPLSRYEAAALSGWVARGGQLVVAGARGYLPEVFGVRFAADLSCLSTDQLEATPVVMGLDDDHQWGSPGTSAVEAELAEELRAPGQEGALTARPVPGEGLDGVLDLPLADPGLLQVYEGSEARVMATTIEDGQAAIVAVPHGRGQVVVVASASPFRNDALAEGDGGVLFARLLGTLGPGAPVLFDEYHLGVGQRRSVMGYLRERGASPLLIYLALLFAFAVWRAWVRGEPLSQRVAPPPTIGESFAVALGSLYGRSRDRAGAVVSVAEHAYGRVARHHHLGPLAGRALAQRLRARGHHEAAKAVDDIAATVADPPDTLRLACERIDRALLRAVPPGAWRGSAAAADGHATIGYRRASP